LRPVVVLTDPKGLRRIEKTYMGKRFAGELLRDKRIWSGCWPPTCRRRPSEYNQSCFSCGTHARARGYGSMEAEVAGLGRQWAPYGSQSTSKVPLVLRDIP
jgi:hypothetical protein